MQIRLLFLVVLTLCFSHVSAAILPVHNVGSKSAKDFSQEDKRLERHVTISAPRIYVGDLLERLTTQTHVFLLTRPEEGASDVEVSVNLHDVPLGDVMDALWSLLSYQKAEWQWTQKGSNKESVYFFEQPDKARAFAASLREQVQKDFEKDAAILLAGSNMSLEERQKYIQKLDKEDQILVPALKDNRLLAGLSIFGNLSSELQESILQGKQKINISSGQLSDSNRAFIHTEWINGQWKKMHRDGTSEPAPEPTEVSLYASRNEDRLVPTLEVELGYMGSLGYAGGMPLENIWKEKMAALWMLPGDASDDALGAKTVTAPKKSIAEAQTDTTFPGRLEQLADAVPLSLIARLSNEKDSSSITNETLYNQKVNACLKHLENANLQHKWRDGILLVTAMSWFMEETPESELPWNIVKRLRDAETLNSGYLPLSEWTWIAAHLSVPQIQHLARRAPVMMQAAAWQNLFVLMDKSPSLTERLLSPQGAVLDGPLIAALKPQIDIDAFVQNRMARRVRAQPNVPSADLPGHGWMFQVLDANGKVLTSGGFLYPANLFTEKKSE